MTQYYRKSLSRIIAGNIRKGTRLGIADDRQKLSAIDHCKGQGDSRSPIEAGLRVIAAEGPAKIHPNKDDVAAPIPVTNKGHALEVASIFEGRRISLAGRIGTNADLKVKTQGRKHIIGNQIR